ncbi:MAG: major capsid protein [bacterium]
MLDDLFKVRTLTTSINIIKPGRMKITDTLFPESSRRGQPSDQYAVDIYTGSQGVMKNISVSAPAVVADYGSRKVVTLEAPRLAEKFFISSARINSLRAFGSQFATTSMQTEIAKGQAEMRRKFDRTREFWASKLLSGQIVDITGTVLVDFNVPADYKPVLAGNDVWTDDASDPVNDIRGWQRLIEEAVGAVDRWVAFCGYSAMDSLINNLKATTLLQYNKGAQIAEEGRVARLAGVDIEEYNATYQDNSGTTQRFIPANVFVLVGYTADGFEEYYAPVVDDEAPGGVGNSGVGQLFFSKAWLEKDPSGWWVKGEGRPLPVMHRVGSVVYATVRA